MPLNVSHDQLAPENVLPELDLRALARRAALPAALAAVAVAVLVLAGGPLQAFADALGRVLDADPRWVVAGAAFELLSFAGYVALLWLVGSRATPRLGLRASTEVTLGGAAATRLLPTGGVGGAALTIWAFRRAGLDARTATRTLLAFLVLLYSVFLGSIALAGGLLSLGLAPGDGPLLLTALPALGAVVAIACALAFAAVRPAGADSDTGAPQGASRLARAGAAAQAAPATIGAAVRDAIALVRSGDVRLLGAPAWWAFDAAVLWAMLNALGAPPSLAVVVLAYFVGQVANTIPIPGAVSGGMVGVLLAFGVEADLALASVLAYRSVAIWLPAPIGLAALGGLRRTFARWASQDAAPAAAPARKRTIARPAWRGIDLAPRHGGALASTAVAAD
ncbi:MAG: lysylphosphatidylglycerol synthase transmembrane domain-containing protein [Solirubrobacteraceae bacterium]